MARERCYTSILYTHETGCKLNGEPIVANISLAGEYKANNYALLAFDISFPAAHVQVNNNLQFS